MTKKLITLFKFETYFQVYKQIYLNFPKINKIPQHFARLALCTTMQVITLCLLFDVNIINKCTCSVNQRLFYIRETSCQVFSQ